MYQNWDVWLKSAHNSLWRAMDSKAQKNLLLLGQKRTFGCGCELSCEEQKGWEAEESIPDGLEKSRKRVQQAGQGAQTLWRGTAAGSSGESVSTPVWEAKVCFKPHSLTLGIRKHDLKWVRPFCRAQGCWAGCGTPRGSQDDPALILTMINWPCDGFAYGLKLT